MKKNKLREECGSVEVEATIILPIAILSVILLLYLSLFMFQRANLQSCLETALVYYKNSATDTFVTPNSEMTYTQTDAIRSAAGNSYSAGAPLSPYRGMGDFFSALIEGGKEGSNDLGNDEQFEKYFRTITGKMLFDDNLELDIDYTSYVIFKQLKVSAVQKVKAPIDFSILGVDNEYEIYATAMVNVIDHDSMIRDVDYAIDIIEGSFLKDYIDKFADTVKSAYQKLKDALGVES